MEGEGNFSKPIKPLTPPEYFPRPEGKEPFLPPFTNGVNQEPLKEGEVRVHCADCGAFLGIKEAIGSDKSHGLCLKCKAKYEPRLEAPKKEKGKE